MRKEACDIITERAIEHMNKGNVPWRQGWIGGGVPCNLVTGKVYRGVNVFVPAMAGYSSRSWLTFNQARKKGGSIKKGEKGTPVVFCRSIETFKRKNGSGEETSTGDGPD